MDLVIHGVEKHGGYEYTPPGVEGPAILHPLWLEEYSVRIEDVGAWGLLPLPDKSWMVWIWEWADDDLGPRLEKESPIHFYGVDLVENLA